MQGLPLAKRGIYCTDRKKMMQLQLMIVYGCQAFVVDAEVWYEQ